MFTLISAAIGGGILCLPYVFSLVGLVNGFILLAIAAFLAYISMRMLLLSAERMCIYSYGKLFAHSMNSPMAGPVLDVITTSFGVGVVIAYFVFLGDFMPPIFATMGVAISRSFCIVLCCALAIPLVLPVKLSALQYLTPVSTLSLVFTAFVVLARCSELQSMRLPGTSDIDLGIVSMSLFKAFAIVISSFICHTNVVAVAGELVDPSVPRAEKIASRAALVQLALYLVISTCGYLSFGKSIQQNFIRNYPVDDHLITACRVMLSVTIFCGLPINTNPTAKSLVNLVQSVGADKRDSLLPATPSDVSNPMPSLRIGFGIATLILGAVVLLMVPGIADVIGLLGGSFGTLIMLVFPALIYARVFRNEMDSLKNQVMVLFLLIAALACFTSVALTVAGLV